jgi:two-component system, OmpR family, response regulator
MGSAWRSQYAGKSVSDKSYRIVLAGSANEMSQKLLEECSRAGLIAEYVMSGRQALQRIQNKTAHIVVVHSDLPDLAASELVRSVRHESLAGVIAVLPEADATDRIIHLELGADEVVTGEMQPREVVARIKNLLRRMAPATPVKARRTFRFGGWVLDPQLRQLTAPHNESVHLTSREYEVLEVLLEHANEVVSRDDLRGSGPINQDSRAIDALVGRLRRKLDDRNEFARMIRPVRNVGYILTQPVETLSA